MARKTRPRTAAPDAQQYEHPIPGRDEILAAMERAGCPLTLKALGGQFTIRGDSHLRALENRLKAMVRDGQLLRNRASEYCLLRHLDLVTGTVQAHRDGYGFVRPDTGGEDIYLPVAEMRSLWDSDRVAVRVRPGRRGMEGQLAEILERGKTELVGRFQREKGVDFVVPVSATGAGEVLIGRGASGGAKPGDVVQVDILQYPTTRTPAVGQVKNVVGHGEQSGIDTEIAILAHGLPSEWSAETLAQVRQWSAEVPASSVRGRQDLRSLPLVTIDGADAKDFDDAVFCEPSGDGWRLIVAIADVAHYVPPGSALDRDARARGTSVYFPDRVLPMLPEALSNGLCSLKPAVDRLCVCCEMHVSPRGAVSKARFFDAVMRSAARLTYEEAWGILEQQSIDTPHAQYRLQLKHLRGVYGALAAARRRRGAIDFDMPEMKIILDERGQVQNVRPSERLETHRIIEECMIAANVETAKQLRKAKIPALYRVHEPPDRDKLEELGLFLKTFGLKLAAPSKLTPKDLSRLLESLRGKPEAQLIETVVLRSLSQAQYQARSLGHFGLALANYSHFTSPIRRYPDLLSHRAIKWLATHGSARGYGYSLGEMEQLGEICSRTERRADSAVWEVQERLKCKFLQSRVGEEFDVRVSSVTAFGLFVRIPELAIDGLVHVTSLPRDYYHVDKSGTALTGESTGRRFGLTEALRVRLRQVDPEERKIDFALAETIESEAAAPRRRRRRHD
jgi:ribonuclease R